MLAVTVEKIRATRMDKLRERLLWRAHGSEASDIAAGDYFTGIAEGEDAGELQIRSRRALWEQWVCRQAIAFLTELDQDPKCVDEIAAVWTAYETCAENAVLYGMVPEFETWLKEHLPAMN